jgi:DNA polymerase-3 subunit alpha
MRESVEEMYDQASRDQKEASLGVLNLFSLIETPEKPFASPPPVLKKSTPQQIFQREKELLGFYLTGHPMDAYRKVLGRLSCVPLHEIHTLPDGAVFRAAFVVDTAAAKISSKSQKKFAILTISDGMERFELPIWPELYEEKGFLLRENQLLYAVLQVERKESGLQLSCKHLDDLTAVDEAKIKICDDLYDKLRAQGAASEAKWKSKEKPVGAAAPEKEKEDVLNLKLKLDADRVKLSEILLLKELFRSHPGKSTVELHFHTPVRRLGVVAVDSQWGVKADKAFQEKLKALAGKMGASLIS